ncbi:hypothetical protein HJG60_008448 [Phyllostomus discolor]|uniref:Uncharacterized protein n=1 Tax=Phyllostomus discolor TaxID=89673 RepID=A0A833YX66_9CHIR|nr:hypothetical protein HJG60_008448 [Phyllostomus discolor]
MATVNGPPPSSGYFFPQKIHFQTRISRYTEYILAFSLIHPPHLFESRQAGSPVHPAHHGSSSEEHAASPACAEGSHETKLLPSPEGLPGRLPVAASRLAALGLRPQAGLLVSHGRGFLPRLCDDEGVAKPRELPVNLRETGDLQFLGSTPQLLSAKPLRAGLKHGSNGLALQGLRMRCRGSSASSWPRSGFPRAVCTEGNPAPDTRKVPGAATPPGEHLTKTTGDPSFRVVPPAACPLGSALRCAGQAPLPPFTLRFLGSDSS